MEKKVDRAPEGTLVYHNSGGKCRYYVQTWQKGKRKRVYLKDGENELRNQLLKKKLRMAMLRDYKNELEAMESFLQKRKDYPLDKILKSEAMGDLLVQISDEWQKADYAKNPYHPEELTLEGANGVWVASKSERDITYGLKDAELANRYEQKTVLGDREVYPDFTIFDPARGRVVLWEHFGLMDNDDYSKKTYSKIELYKQHGFFPGDNLIMTFEDKKHPLTEEKIRLTIEEYFGKWLEIRKKARDG